MSMPAIFFTSTEVVAKTVHLNHALPREDVAELSSIDTLKMSTLWAILDEAEWDVKLMDAFEEIYALEEEWLHRIPDALTKKIALLDDAKLDRVSKAWAATDEMLCEPSEAAELFRIIAAVAARSIHTHRGFFLYTSL
jgi:hypothetical protein